MWIYCKKHVCGFRWWSWGSWPSRLRTADSVWSARVPSSHRLSTAWRRTTTPASSRRPGMWQRGETTHTHTPSLPLSALLAAASVNSTLSNAAHRHRLLSVLLLVDYIQNNTKNLQNYGQCASPANYFALVTQWPSCDFSGAIISLYWQAINVNTVGLSYVNVNKCKNRMDLCCYIRSVH